MSKKFSFNSFDQMKHSVVKTEKNSIQLISTQIWSSHRLVMEKDNPLWLKIIKKTRQLVCTDCETSFQFTFANKCDNFYSKTQLDIRFGISTSGYS